MSIRTVIDYNIYYYKKSLNKKIPKKKSLIGHQIYLNWLSIPKCGNVLGSDLGNHNLWQMIDILQ